MITVIWNARLFFLVKELTLLHNPLVSRIGTDGADIERFIRTLPRTFLIDLGVYLYTIQASHEITFIGI